MSRRRGKAGSSKGRQGDGNRKKKARKTVYYIVQINANIKIVKEAELKSLRAKTLKEYQQKIKAYNEAKREASKRGRTFTQSRPRFVFKVLNSKGITDFKKAQTLRDKAMAKLKKALAGSKDKKTKAKKSGSKGKAKKRKK